LYLSMNEAFWWRDQIYRRWYLCSTDKMGLETYFVATNEPVNHDGELWDYEQNHFEVTALDGWDGLMNNLVNGTYAAEFKNSVHGPPLYVYYDIDIVDEQLKSKLLKHLLDDVSGYADDYFKSHFQPKDVERIDKWKNWLEPSNETQK